MARIALAALVVAFTFVASPVHAQGVPGVDKNKCLAGKYKCVSKKLAGLLKCREKCAKKPDNCAQKQADCEAKVINKFEGGADPSKGCFAKVEAKADPGKPDTVCTTTGDTATIEAQLDATVADIVASLEPLTCADLGGAEVGGFCWFLSAVGQSCDGICAAQSLSCDLAGTRDHAGSGGSLANCAAVMVALGQGGDTPIDAAGAFGIGCVYDDRPIRVTSPATTCAADANFGTFPRACACI